MYSKKCESDTGRGMYIKHRLVVGDLTLKGARVTKRKFVPRLKVWKLKEENARRQFNMALAIREAEVAQASGVNDKWEAMKKAWVMTTEEVCGWTKGPPRHKETWWWSPEVAKAVDEKRRCFKVWYNSKENSDNDIYKMAKRNAKKLIAKAQEEKRHEFAKEMECADGIGNMVRMAKQMSKKRQDVIGVKCLKNMEGKMTIDSNGIKNTWKIYMKGLLNEENEWNNISCAKVEGPGCKFGKNEIKRAVKKMKIGKASGLTMVVSEMFKGSDDLGIEWLMNLANQIVTEGTIPEDWQRSIIIPVYKGKGDPLDCGSYRAIKLLEHAIKVFERVLE
ncbi:unnamed protein product [Gordionus sp. m RMFG-2023]